MSADLRLLTRAGELRSGRMPFVLATVVRVERPTSARPGDAALVLPDGTMEGFVGGACAESATRLEGLRMLQAGESGLLRITPGGDVAPRADGVRTVDNPCLSGGSVEIFFESVIPPALVMVFGEAPVARALVRLGEALDFEVRTGPDVASDAAAVVVASHGRDETRVLTAALAARVPYVALLASPRRAAGVLAELAASGVPDADRRRVHAPAGLDIGARTPAAIALSIYAEMQATSPPLRPSERPAPGATPWSAATDPVCGMAVAAVGSSLQAEHAGETVYFCGPGCRQAFADDPTSYGR